MRPRYHGDSPREMTSAEIDEATRGPRSQRRAAIGGVAVPGLGNMTPPKEKKPAVWRTGRTKTGPSIPSGYVEACKGRRWNWENSETKMLSDPAVLNGATFRGYVTSEGNNWGEWSHRGTLYRVLKLHVR